MTFDFTFDIDFAADKDALKSGEVVSGTHRVSVRADTLNEATLVANQMVFATGREPTAARLIDVLA